MLKTKRRALQFDSLEGKVLLSMAMADPATTVHRHAVKRFDLNGTVSGLPNGKPSVGGFTETSFLVAGHAGSMGKVNGSFVLTEPFIPSGKSPDLAGALLTLENAKGTMELAIAPAVKGHYRFTIVSGSHAYASASGSGTMTISSPPYSLDFVIKLHSTATRKG